MQSLSLFKTNKERLYFLILASFIISINILFYFLEYKDFIKEEIYQTKATVLNIYPKQNRDVIKIQTENFISFTSINKNHNLTKLQNIEIYLLTKDITFYKYIKGFYTPSFNFQALEIEQNYKSTIDNYILSQHSYQNISSIYSALFLAIPIDGELRDMFAKFGISHLIAISGFHLGVISMVFYFILNILYKPIHQKYLPYRNRRFDILIIISIVLFIYLLFTNMVPSLLRAFTMYIFAIFLLRNNIKIVSFETLLIIVLILISIFPKLIFSLSLWFSVAGVFYIFLFLHYFKDLNKYIQIIVFNFWIYLSINPITHYFFGTTAYEQLISPILTLLFTIFYPLMALLHIIGYGGVFDSLLESAISLNIDSKEIFTPFWFFILYLTVSLFSTINKYSFYFLNILSILFNTYLYNSI